jgi:hypothetical protein
VLLFFLPLASSAQVASPGLPPLWETKQMLTTFIAGFERLKPLLEQIKPQTWKDQVAGEAYQKQAHAAQDGLRFLGYNIENLIHQPDTLPVALESFLRMQSLESSIVAITGAIRRHQDTVLADRLEAVLAANSDNKEKLRQYLIDLAAAREEEFRLVDREAQKCRNFLSRPPASNTKDGKR